METFRRPLILVVASDEWLRRAASKLEIDFLIVRASEHDDPCQVARRAYPEALVATSAPGRSSLCPLLQSWRSDPITRTIPFLFVGREDEQCACLDLLLAGAEDVVVGPLRDGELTGRIKRRLNYSGRPSIAGLDVFLEQATLLTDLHLHNPDFGASQLAAALCVSEPTLRRKLQRIAGCPPQRFISLRRLERAHRLLARRACNVTEAAALAGFASASHFTRSYCGRFGIQPHTVGLPESHHRLIAMSK